jgi:ferredoxin
MNTELHNKTIKWEDIITGKSFKQFRSFMAKRLKEKRTSQQNIAEFCLGIYAYLEPYAKSTLKLTKLPLLSKVGHLLLDTKNSNTTYIPVHESVEIPESTVAPISIVEHFIKQSSSRFLMAYCACRKACDCSNHPQDIGCIWVGGATAEIDLPKEIGRHVSVDEAIAHLHRAREAGLITLFGKFKPDAIAMGVGSDDKRFMTLCSCCKCCCMVKYMKEGKPEYKNILHKLKGLSVNIDTKKCVGCGTCSEVCMWNMISLENNKAHIGNDCKGCGFCANACPQQAITIKIDDPTYIEEAIDRIESAVDVSS